MSLENRTQLFDNWAKNYDQTVPTTEGFPFDGYERVLDTIVKRADIKPGMSVLDMGIGTGNLAERLLVHDCTVWGVDFSAEMLAKTRTKLPSVKIVQANLLQATWPSDLNQRFDRIVSAYVLHEFDLPTKMTLLARLIRRHLTANGRLIIGDIAFVTAQIRAEAHQRWAERWDEDEFYWSADEAIEAGKKIGLQITYRQISSCGGVFEVKKI